jgi:putative hydrolase of the HAD superfamily
MQQMEGIKAIVFDLGGVIVDLDRDRAVRYFEEAGVKNAGELLNAYHQTGIFKQFEEGSLDRETFYTEFCKLVGKETPHAAIDRGWMGFIANLEQYKLDMLDELRKKYAVYLLSNTNPVVMEWAHSPAFSKEGRILPDYFDKLYLSYQIGCLKPDKAIFEYVIKDAEIIPEETLFVDDGKDNCEAAAALGFKTFMPRNGEDFRYIFE